MGVLRRVCGAVGLLLAMALGVVALLLLVAVIRAVTIEGEDYRDPGLEGLVREELPGLYLQTLPELMGRALAIPTVSSAPGDYDTEQLLRFHAFLRESFPNAFNASFVEVEVVNNYSFLFTVKGSDPALQPYLLAAHMDVVPVDVSKWTQDPWSGQVIPDPETGEDYVWGRGAIDDKLGVMGIMAALDYLVTSGFQPTRSFYVAFGHDEEVHGEDGAGHIGALLQERGVALDFVLDEGMPVLDGVMAGMEIPVAAIGVTEKGWMRVRLEADGEGGHSSIPPHDQAVTRLASALVNLQRYPQPSMFGEGTEADLLTLMAHKASWPHKLVYANTWLFEPLLKVIMSRSRETNAIIRTTTAATIVRAGVKENVVPASAWAILNHRVHPAQPLEDVVKHDIAAINDPRIKVTVEDTREAHPISPYGPHVPGWRLLAATVAQIFPEAVTVPSMLVGNTDTKSYLSMSRNVYRFLPVRMTARDIQTIHGHDERVSSRAVGLAASFYHRLILTADVGAHALRTRPGHRAGEL